MLLATTSLCVFPLEQAADVESGKVTRAQCDAWVQQLANRSPRPFADGSVEDEPKNVDRKSLADVKVAYDQLSTHFPESLPSLIAGLPDKRYSYYYEVPSSGSFICDDVGRACEHIIRSHIEVFRGYLTVLDLTDVPRSVDFLAATGGAEKWYRARMNKPLFELQLEAIDWALKQDAPNPGIQQSDWAIAIERLKKFRVEFVNGKTAIDPKHRLLFRGK